MTIGDAAEFNGGFVRPEERRSPADSVVGGSSEGGRRDAAPERSSEPVAQPASRSPTGMLMSTTGTIDGFRITKYLGLVDADAILGANMARDMLAGLRDMVGGRVGSYEKVFAEAKRKAIAELTSKASMLKANAVVGIALSCETIQVEGGGNIMMVSAIGTAVKIVER